AIADEGLLAIIDARSAGRAATAAEMEAAVWFEEVARGLALANGLADPGASVRSRLTPTEQGAERASRERLQFAQRRLLALASRGATEDRLRPLREELEI